MLMIGDQSAGLGDLRLGEDGKHLRDDAGVSAALKRFANLYSICIVAGIFESSVDATRVYNTVVVIDENGVIKDPYRKIHLYDAFGTKESERVIAGDGLFK